MAADKHTDMYITHCKGEFKYLRDGLDALNVKVFNGLSDLPREMRQVKRLLISLLVSLILVSGGVVVSSVAGQVRSEALLQAHLEQGE